MASSALNSQKDARRRSPYRKRVPHGHTVGGVKSPTMQSWDHMMQRCRDKTDKDYGGRGIKVCRRWHMFPNFLADMGERPEGMTLDRIDVNGNYHPDNVKWSSRSEQQRNRRR